MIRKLNPLLARAAALILVALMPSETLFAYSVRWDYAPTAR
jgi:hypothetical protein